MTKGKVMESHLLLSLTALLALVATLLGFIVSYPNCSSSSST